MVLVVGKEGALWTGVGGNCSSGMDGFKTIPIYIMVIYCCYVLLCGRQGIFVARDGTAP